MTFELTWIRDLLPCCEERLGQHHSDNGQKKACRTAVFQWTHLSWRIGIVPFATLLDLIKLLRQSRLRFLLLYSSHLRKILGLTPKLQSSTRRITTTNTGVLNFVFV